MLCVWLVLCFFGVVLSISADFAGWCWFGLAAMYVLMELRCIAEQPVVYDDRQ